MYTQSCTTSIWEYLGLIFWPGFITGYTVSTQVIEWFPISWVCEILQKKRETDVPFHGVYPHNTTSVSHSITILSPFYHHSITILYHYFLTITSLYRPYIPIISLPPLYHQILYHYKVGFKNGSRSVHVRVLNCQGQGYNMRPSEGFFFPELAKVCKSNFFWAKDLGNDLKMSPPAKDKRGVRERFAKGLFWFAKNGRLQKK